MALDCLVSLATTATAQHQSRNTSAKRYRGYLQLSGRTVARGEDALAFEAGDIGFGRRRQLNTWFEGRYVHAMVPRAMIERQAPWLRDRPHLSFGSNARFSRNLRLHMMDLTADDAAFSESETGLLADSLCNLVALAAAEGMPTRRMEPELQTEALFAFCRQNLDDPELSPQQAADYLGISVRTLHSRFQRIGQTLGRWLLESRLEGCGAALRDPNQRSLNISEIVYRWGFNDPSNFNKAFRAQYGMTPSEWRHASNSS